ncbi:hypothetical protein V1514DRAFT_332825 [Lipomyces japonicus]|uniref:uncharacterized protein n=1 Tax=Lipomyces japonicus TaxID=56871 RepID=UPI0034CF31E3
MADHHHPPTSELTTTTMAGLLETSQSIVSSPLASPALSLSKSLSPSMSDAESLDDGQAEMVNITQHGSISQMVRAGRRRQQQQQQRLEEQVDNDKSDRPSITVDTAITGSETSNDGNGQPHVNASQLALSPIIEMVTPTQSSTARTAVRTDSGLQAPSILSSAYSSANHPHDHVIRSDTTTMTAKSLPEFSKFNQVRPGGIVRSKRPPPLFIEPVSNFYDRLSVTSFGDLVKRATNTIRGTVPEPSKVTKENSVSNNAFGIGNDNNVGDSFKTNQVDARLPKSPEVMGTETSNKFVLRNRRRVCGLPWWAFALIVAGIVITIVVCIIVPLQVTSQNGSRSEQPPALSKSQSSTSTPTIDLPSSIIAGFTTMSLDPTPASASSVPASATATSTGTVTTAQCEARLSCQNDGVIVMKDDKCACECASGFAGTTCVDVSSASCGIQLVRNSTITATSADDYYYRNVTLGTAIITLLANDTRQEFPAISLDALTIYQTFYQSGVSCASQNALVTFNGEAKKRMVMMKQRRGPVSHYERESSSSSSSSSLEITDTVLKFARLVVLFIVQTNKSVSDAVTVQQAMQDTITANDIPSNGTVEFSNGLVMSFLNFTILQY